MIMIFALVFLLLTATLVISCYELYRLTKWMLRSRGVTEKLLFEVLLYSALGLLATLGLSGILTAVVDGLG